MGGVVGGAVGVAVERVLLGTGRVVVLGWMDIVLVMACEELREREAVMLTAMM
jgi:hypothetical protein